MDKVSLWPPTTWVRERWNRGSRCSITKVVESGAGTCSELRLRLNFQIPVKSGFAIGPSEQTHGAASSRGTAKRLSEAARSNDQAQLPGPRAVSYESGEATSRA